MSAMVTPHLNFRGQAREALEFYASVFAAEATIVTYENAGLPGDAANGDDVIWGQVENSAGVRLMAYDVQADRPYDAGTNAVYVAVRSDDAEEIRRYWDGLVQDAEVRTDLGPSAFSPVYGMLRDRFGTTWVLDVQA